ncbi:MAG: glycosyltransferase [Halomonadaceae bacterium]|jgi:glycosyltransferase involved in cell wall biosynthesis
MKKISLIISGLRGGGAERVCVTLANGLADRGYQVDLVVLGLRDAVREREIISEVNLVNLNVEHARYAAFQLLKYLRSVSPQTVISFNGQISVILALLRKVGRLNFRLVSRNINFSSISTVKKKDLWHGLIVNLLIKKFYALSDLVIAQSAAMKRDIAEYYGYPLNKIEVIHNPVSHIINETENNHESWCGSQEYLLCVGRLEEQKAFHRAIEAFARISKDYPNLRLKIVGQGKLEEKLKEQALEVGLEERIDFEGYQANIVPFYVYAKGTILTSLYEGFPNVLVESIALGTPVVAFDCKSGPREIIIEGKNGYLAEDGDIDSLVNKLQLLLKNELNVFEVKQTASKFSRDGIISAYERAL